MVFLGVGLLLFFVLVVVGAIAGPQPSAKEPKGKNGAAREGRADVEAEAAVVAERKARRKAESSNIQIAGSTPRQIARQVRTLRQYAILERKFEKAEMGVSKLLIEDRSTKRYDVLQEAMDLLRGKTLAWQFSPECDVETPLEILEQSQRVVDADDFESVLQQTGTERDLWSPLESGSEPEETEEPIIFLRKFRRIVENKELTDSERDKKINALVARNKKVAEEWFDIDGPQKAAAQWREDYA